MNGKDKVVYLKDCEGLGEVIEDLTRAFKEGKILDVALIFRRKPFAEEDKTAPDGREIYSYSQRHWYTETLTYTVRGMLQALDDFICESDTGNIVEE